MVAQVPTQSGVVVSLDDSFEFQNDPNGPTLTPVSNNMFSAYSMRAHADSSHNQPIQKGEFCQSPMLSSPTFNTLQISGDGDIYDFGVAACCEIERTITSPLHMLEQMYDELTLTQNHSKEFPTG